MVIALAVSAAAVVGVLVWWLRRAPRRAGETEGRPELPARWGWDARLAPEARIAFMEGLRACSDDTGPVRAGREQGVLATDDPPRLVSLHLLADLFAARGEEGLHDPEGTLTELIAKCAAVEQPGVLHLRTDWLAGMVDGMDQSHFAEAVRGVVGPERAAGVGTCTVDDRIGALWLTIAAAPADGPVPEQPAPEQPAPEQPAPKRPASEPAERPASGRAGEPVSEEAWGEAANTLMLDLSRILERYREARGEQPGATAEALLRTVVPHEIAGGGSGVTWAYPPSPRQHRIALMAATSPEPR
ncbi:hypothetical protein [Nonomuraea indica]|uniref:hypothetical protein n=1 Tax=Nonomuraea indica TaxID=1581193 RepID=UPI0015DD6FCA|nr:hypothetical protein [Nonomuraea indica]